MNGYSLPRIGILEGVCKLIKEMLERPIQWVQLVVIMRRKGQKNPIFFSKVDDLTQSGGIVVIQD